MLHSGIASVRIEKETQLVRSRGPYRVKGLENQPAARMPGKRFGKPGGTASATSKNQDGMIGSVVAFEKGGPV